MSFKDRLLARTGDLTAAPPAAAKPAPAADAPAPATTPANRDTAAGAGTGVSTPAAPNRSPARSPHGAGERADGGSAAPPAMDTVAIDPVRTAPAEAAPVDRPAPSAAEPSTRAQPVRGPGQGAAAPSATGFPPLLTGAAAAARTGPGQMLQFRGQMLAAEGELNRLREQLKQHEGALPARRLPPEQVVHSRWANRHADSFSSPAFERLKQDIESAGGNVQPILVRALGGEPARYELVFGHRRHRACAELGLPVLAMVTDAQITEHELFSAMDRENRERADLSPWEQGQMYRRALDDKLYASNRRLAEALGVSHTWVANVLAVADLPEAVVQCFRSPLEIQHRHARLIHQALDADRKAVLRRAERLRQQGRAAATAVVQALAGASQGATAGTDAGRPAAASGRAAPVARAAAADTRSGGASVALGAAGAGGETAETSDSGVLGAHADDQVLALDGEALGAVRRLPDGALLLRLDAGVLERHGEDGVVRALLAWSARG